MNKTGNVEKAPLHQAGQMALGGPTRQDCWETLGERNGEVRYLGGPAG